MRADMQATKTRVPHGARLRVWVDPIACRGGPGRPLIASARRLRWDRLTAASSPFRLADEVLQASDTSQKKTAHFLASAFICTAGIFLPTTGCLASEVPAVAQVEVTVTVKSGSDLRALGSSPTLFLTAKPANNKYPFASREDIISEAESWPRSIRLGSLPEDVLATPEQYDVLAGILDENDVIISARLDKDGDPTTRDGEDLVGRGVSSWDAMNGIRRPVTVQLEGRGVFGKMVTARTSAAH